MKCSVENEKEGLRKPINEGGELSLAAHSLQLINFTSLNRC